MAVFANTLFFQKIVEQANSRRIFLLSYFKYLQECLEANEEEEKEF
jgi:hypothetical protein